MKKILLVEDDPFLVEMYTFKLTGEDSFEVESASDGEEVFLRIKEQIPDLIILDLVLPKMDGYEVLKTIKKDPALKNIKILLLSNLGEDIDIKKGLDMGADAYLIKAHFTPTEVVEKVKELLGE